MPTAMWLLLIAAGCGTRAEAPKDTVPTADEAVLKAPALQDPAGDALSRLKQELAQSNPDFDSEQFAHQTHGDSIVALELRDAGVHDISALTNLPLEVLSLSGNPVADLAPLRGMPLAELDLEQTRVRDLAALSGLPLRRLWLNNCPVSDLSPLAGMTLDQLSLLGTNVVDLTPLQGMPLESLWLNETAVTDLNPLAGSPLVSLTLHRTGVSDLSVARNWPSLQRLHLGESAVSDLTPLKGLRLTRLIVTPANIHAGWDVVREMGTLTELDIEFRQPRLWTPEEFWRRFDAGEFSTPATTSLP